MFGLWFSIVGLVFGILSSFKAKEKNRAQKEWFMLGFIFSFLAFGIVLLLPENNNAEQNDALTGNEDFYISAKLH